MEVLLVGVCLLAHTGMAYTRRSPSFPPLPVLSSFASLSHGQLQSKASPEHFFQMHYSWFLVAPDPEIPTPG